MGQAMTLRQALYVFDQVLFDLPDYPDQPGTVRCCGVAVVMRNGQKVECLKCGRAVSMIGNQWMVMTWGAKVDSAIFYCAGTDIRESPLPHTPSTDLH